MTHEYKTVKTTASKTAKLHNYVVKLLNYTST